MHHFEFSSVLGDSSTPAGNLNCSSNNMPKPYSKDLRWRAVWLNVVRGMNSFEIADLLFMSERSVQRYLSLFHSTGSVAPKDSTGGPGKLLTETEQFSILQSLIHNPSTFLHEIQSQL